MHFNAILIIHPYHIQMFIRQHSIRPLKRYSQITAMTTLRKSSSADDNGVSYLVIATESGDLFILDVQSFTVVQEVIIVHTKPFSKKQSVPVPSNTFPYIFRPASHPSRQRPHLCRPPATLTSTIA